MSDSPVDPDVERLLTGDPVTAHPATSIDDRPHVAPVRFRYEDARPENTLVRIRVESTYHHVYD
jgi:hypothetical protein